MKESIKIKRAKRTASMKARLLKKKASLDIAKNSDEVKECIRLCKLIEKVEFKLEKAESNLERAQEEYRKAQSEHDKVYMMVKKLTQKNKKKSH